MITIKFATPRSTVAVVVDAYRDRLGAAALEDLSVMLHSIMPLSHRDRFVTKDDILVAKALPLIHDCLQWFIKESPWANQCLSSPSPPTELL